MPQPLQDPVWTTDATTVLVLSGISGCVIGALLHEPQAAVEGAQVVAGLVHYSAANPFGIFQTNTWTLLHQVLAPMLRLGIPEAALSLLLSAVAGAITFMALALIVWVLARRVAVACLAPFVVFAGLGRSVAGVAYPVIFLGSPHSYGMIGLSFSMLALALAGAGATRAGALLLGLSVAVHPSLGLWVNGVVFLVILWEFRILRGASRRALPFYLCGVAASALSLAVQKMAISRTLDTLASEPAVYLTAFLKDWDVHRHPFGWSLALIAAMTTVVFAAWWLFRHRPELGDNEILLLRAFVVFGVVAAVLSLSLWLPSHVVPPVLSMLMPARVFNFDILALLPLTIGLAARAPTNAAAQTPLLVLIGFTLLGDVVPPLQFPVPCMVTGVWLAVSTSRRGVTRMPSDLARRARRAVYAAVAGVAVLRIAVSVDLDMWRDDQVIVAAAAGQGTLVTGSDIKFIQMRTRRPVLLNGEGLDSLPYFPETGPEMARILREVYGVDFFNPPAEMGRRGGLAKQTGRALWERRTPAEWRTLAERFDVHQVLTYGDWLLQLPASARSAEYTLYEIR